MTFISQVHTSDMRGQAFKKLKKIVLKRLEGLSSDLTYHSLAHTLDVLQQCERIAIEEGITDPDQLFLLRIAALYHDTGFLRTYSEHESKGCNIFLEDVDGMGFSEQEKTLIVNLIMATKIPQKPKTLLEKVICDADLDYLGRNDFFSIGDSLRKEFLCYHVIGSNDEWESLQLNFLQNHRYHTQSSRKLREPVKQKNYLQLL